RFDEVHDPVFGRLVVTFDAAVAGEHAEAALEGNRVGKILFDHVATVAEGDHELAAAPGRVVLHDMPQDRPSADLDHRLRAQLGFLAEPAADSPRKYDDSHFEERLYRRGAWDGTCAALRRRSGYRFAVTAR